MHRGGGDSDWGTLRRVSPCFYRVYQKLIPSQPAEGVRRVPGPPEYARLERSHQGVPG